MNQHVPHNCLLLYTKPPQPLAAGSGNHSQAMQGSMCTHTKHTLYKTQNIPKKGKRLKLNTAKSIPTMGAKHSGIILHPSTTQLCHLNMGIGWVPCYVHLMYTVSSLAHTSPGSRTHFNPRSSQTHPHATLKKSPTCVLQPSYHGNWGRQYLSLAIELQRVGLFPILPLSQPFFTETPIH